MDGLSLIRLRASTTAAFNCVVVCMPGAISSCKDSTRLSILALRSSGSPIVCSRSRRWASSSRVSYATSQFLHHTSSCKASMKQEHRVHSRLDYKDNPRQNQLVRQQVTAIVSLVDTKHLSLTYDSNDVLDELQFASVLHSMCV